MGPSDGRRASLADAEVANFALAHELAHRPDRVLDRHGPIDTMDVVEVNDIGLEPLQAALAARLNVFWPAVRCWRAVGCAQIAELAGDHVLVAMALHRASDQFLVTAQTIGVRAVKKMHADLARAAQSVNRHIFIGLIVERRHCCAAETDRGNLKPAKPPPFHPSTPVQVTSR